jgi:hypothetical protein
MFSFGIGSTGEGPPAYLAQISFTLSPDFHIDTDDDNAYELLGHDCKVSKVNNQYLLLVSGFSCEEAASTFLAKASAALIWSGLRKPFGLKVEHEIKPVTFFPEPIPVIDGNPLAPSLREKGWEAVDGHYLANQTTIRPDHKRLTFFHAGDVSLRQGMTASHLIEALVEGLDLGHPELVLADPKLLLACEVYLSSYFEKTDTASFLSRITALEILAPETEASDTLKSLVEQFMHEVSRTRREASQDDHELQRELHGLSSSLGRLRSRSIKNSIRNLVGEVIQNETGSYDLDSIPEEVSKLYDLRSSLVHDGKGNMTEVNNGNNKLSDIVPRVLRARFRDLATNHTLGSSS